MILGLHHAAMAVPDLEAALRCYGDVLGFEVADTVKLPGGIVARVRAFGLEGRFQVLCHVDRELGAEPDLQPARKRGDESATHPERGRFHV